MCCQWNSSQLLRRAWQESVWACDWWTSYTNVGFTYYYASCFTYRREGLNDVGSLLLGLTVPLKNFPERMSFKVFSTHRRSFSQKHMLEKGSRLKLRVILSLCQHSNWSLRNKYNRWKTDTNSTNTNICICISFSAFHFPRNTRCRHWPQLKSTMKSTVRGLGVKLLTANLTSKRLQRTVEVISF